jgi:four helix bundle suffix protein
MQPYKKLFTYWYCLVIYDLTVEFCERWVKSWKLKEQMSGAARSSKQNVVEGSRLMSTSLKSAIKLTNVAYSSIEELLADIEDFIRQHSLNQWSKNDPRIKKYRAQVAKIVSQLSRLSRLRDPKVGKLLDQVRLPKGKKEAANFMLTLCHQAAYLLKKQVESLERKHETEGGYTEKLYQRRVSFRKNS